MSATTTVCAVDRGEVIRALKLFLDPGQVTELRILKGKFAESGFFNDHMALANAVAKHAQADGCYFVPNPIKPELINRAYNRMRSGVTATGDKDITDRWKLLVDIDPVRAAGISSSHVEHELAIARARKIASDLGEIGWPMPAIVDSGNGGHLVYWIFLPADDGGLVKRVLQALAFQFDDADVIIDQSVFNQSRIWKLPGTWARKGDNTPERPHRMARILEAPEEPENVTKEELERFAAFIPKPEPKSRNPLRVRENSFDLQRWIDKHTPEVVGPDKWGDKDQRWVFPVCPWNPDHTNRSAFIVQLASGPIAAGCRHNSCDGNDWHGLRDLREPGWRDRWGGYQAEPSPNFGTNGHGSGAQAGEEPPPHGDPGPMPGTAPTIKVFETFDAADRADWTCKEVRWLIQNVLAADHIGYDHSLPKCFKSWRALAMAVSVTLGADLFGRFPTQQGRVLYLANEDKLRRFKDRLAEIEAGHKQVVPKGSLVILPIRDQADPKNRTLDLTHLIDRRAIIQAGKGFDLIVADMIAYCMGDLDEDKKSDFTKFATILREIQDTTGAALYGVEHDRKGLANRSLRGTEPDPQDMRGSGAKFGLVDCIASAKRPTDDRRVIVRIENRDHDEVLLLGVQVAAKDSGLPKVTAFDLKAAAEMQKTKGNDNKARVLQELEDGAMTVKMLHKNLRAKFPKDPMAETTIQGHLNTLVEEGKVTRNGNAHRGGYLYELTKAGTHEGTHEMDFASRESGVNDSPFNGLD